ncbi:heme exporter protein CcmD [Croceicoccus pelagius]|uniref:Heme exporter protein D n=1 Tax=Croceicoccus pelagius TaxID=1703341 RepID=A0A916YCM9_9SPHN|nr:heme exporter protein CcmD [Croceicoccus pelagius]GGD38429.1 hypothetical protein GCM10010989_10680 [Croceicoccus pelagius]
MNEGLDHWPFVIAAYAIGIGGMLAMVVWSWLSMRRAEARRDAAKGRK